MSSIFSTVVFHDVLTVGFTPVTLYTVPAGNVFICRDIELYQEQLGGNPAAVVRFAEGIANRYWFAAGMPVTVFSHRQWEGRQVFLAGMELQGVANAEFTTARISGYLLTA